MVVVVAELRLKCDKFTPVKPADELPVEGDVFKFDLFSSFNMGGLCRVEAFDAVVVLLPVERLGTVPSAMAAVEGVAAETVGILVDLVLLVAFIPADGAGVVLLDEVGPLDGLAKEVGSPPDC